MDIVFSECIKILNVSFIVETYLCSIFHSEIEENIEHKFLKYSYLIDIDIELCSINVFSINCIN